MKLDTRFGTPPGLQPPCFSVILTFPLPRKSHKLSDRLESVASGGISCTFLNVRNIPGSTRVCTPSEAPAQEPPALGTFRITHSPFQQQDSLSCYFENASRPQ